MVRQLIAASLLTTTVFSSFPSWAKHHHSVRKDLSKAVSDSTAAVESKEKEVGRKKPSQVHWMCTSDFKKLCPGVEIGSIDARTCLKRMMEDAPEVISMPCRAALHIMRDRDERVM